VRVLDLADPDLVTKLPLDEPDRPGRRPVRLVFGARAALALDALDSDEGQRGHVVEPVLTAFELPGVKSGPPLPGRDRPEARKIWKHRLASPSEGAFRVGVGEPFGDTLGLFVRPRDPGGAVRQSVVRIEDGAVFDCAPLVLGAGQTPLSREPVVLNGRVIVECEEGIACLEGAE
jgi:hypothetical protein